MTHCSEGIWQSQKGFPCTSPAAAGDIRVTEKCHPSAFTYRAFYVASRCCCSQAMCCLSHSSFGER